MVGTLLRFAAGSLALNLLAAPPEAPGGWDGNWLGTVAAGPVKLRVGLRLTQTPAGLAGTLDSIDQAVTGIPAKPVVTGRSITVEVPKVGGAFKGTLSDDGRHIAGTWKQGGGTAPLTFDRVDAFPALRRPQEPSRPYPYEEEEVTYEGRGVKLAGTLTLPRGKGPHPAVLLLTGSGAQDRNESIMGHRPFLVLADYLTRRGVAVLRMDDRGVGGSTGIVVASTEEDFTADALAGVAFLKSRKEVDSRRIGLAGHSEGGLVAALAASRSQDLAFLIMLAGPGLPGDQIIMWQVEKAVESAGVPAGRAAESIAMQRKVLDIVLREKDDAAALEQLEHALAPMLALMPEAARTAKQNELRLATTKWYRSFVATDPRPALAKLRIPVLALNGELDTQVAADENLASIAAALKAGGSTDYTAMKLPGLNHLFQRAKTGAITEYREIEETINPEALRVIGEWLDKRVLPNSAAR